MSTADNKFRLKEDGQQKDDKLSVQLKNTRLTQVTEFHYLCRDRHEISTTPAKMITYQFFFEGLITEFGNNYRNRFFPWEPIFEFGNNYRPVFPQGSHF